VAAPSRFFEGAEGLVFLPLIFNSIEKINSDQPLIELTDFQAPHFQVLTIFPAAKDGKNAVEFSFLPTKNGAPYDGIGM
jgi:hypothetical protein